MSTQPTRASRKAAQRSARSPSKVTPWLKWLLTLLRLVMGAAFIYAGILKLSSPHEALMSVQAYELFNYNINHALSIIIPWAEVIVGLLFLTGTFIKYSGLCMAAMLGIYIIAIASAQHRGLHIDCGCFSKGGQVNAKDVNYASDIFRDILMLIVVAVVTRYRKMHTFAVDSWLYK